LKHLRPEIKIGLHFTLTQLSPLSPLSHVPSITQDGHFLSFPRLYVKSISQNINKYEVRQEFVKQVEFFQEIFGFFPDFIDGHQHVQQLPIINHVVIGNTIRFDLPPDFFIRNSSLPAAVVVRCLTPLGASGFLKNMLLAIQGNNFRKKLAEKGVGSNSALLGTYNFRSKKAYADVFAFYTKIVGSKSVNNILYYCHPGLPEPSPCFLDDPIQQRRTEEFHFFNGLRRQTRARKSIPS